MAEVGASQHTASALAAADGAERPAASADVRQAAAAPAAAPVADASADASARAQEGADTPDADPRSAPADPRGNLSDAPTNRLDTAPASSLGDIQDEPMELLPDRPDASREQHPGEAQAGAAADAPGDERAEASGVDGPAGAQDVPTREASSEAVSEDQDSEEQADEQELARRAKREAQHKQKAADSMKRFTYLLGQTELFQHFINVKKDRDPAFAAMIEQSAEAARKGKGKKKDGTGGSRRRKTEKEEDAELLHDEEDEDEPLIFEESPQYVKGGELRPYQIAGLNWMISLYHHGINGILADEMGLGKTLQTISFLGYLKFFKNTPRYHLVVVPKSTLDNWRREFAKWVPGFDTLVLQGTKQERRELIDTKLAPGKFDVLITTYEMCLREKNAIRKFSWEYIVIDEAHRIKNADSLLSQIVRTFDSRGRLLITGTPLQNNLMELWALLNFLLPDVFSDAADFEAWFKEKGGEENQDQVVQQLHKVLRPFLLRRVKADVEKSLLPKKEINMYVGMTDMQRKWYKALLEKDIDAVNGAGSKKEGKTRLLNIVMQLRKCCNHPYLFDGAEPGPPFTTDQHLIDNAGKMVVLDKLLKSLKAKGSRVLIFSQMSRMLDILEDYCFFRDYQYSRIDGNTAHEDRIQAIDEYNSPGSEKFVFLLTTRAGGLGINLTSADVVILFDSDWNPQADLQAMDRAHRIGQTKQVYVFRFVTEHAVEERILERAQQKLRLDQLVIQQGRSQPTNKTQSKDELVDMIQHGAERIIRGDEPMLVDGDIDQIIADGEKRTAALQEKYQDIGFDALTNMQEDGGTTAYSWEGKDFRPGHRPLAGLWIEPAKRERKVNYSVDGYYRQITGPSKPAGSKPKLPRAPKQVALNDWQFYPPRLGELQQREMHAYQRSIGFKVPLREPKDDETNEQVAAEQQAEQQAVDTAEELTEAEADEKEQLALEGFHDWSKRDFTTFIKAAEKHGRGAFADMAQEWPGEAARSAAEVRAYSKVFWARGPSELADWEKVLARIEEGEAKLAKQSDNERLLRKKVATYRNPREQIKLVYGPTKGRSTWTEDEDRYLLVRLAHYGLGGEPVYDQIRADIINDPTFKFDWFLKSRTTHEVGRRCLTLMSLFLKEDPPKEEAKSKTKPGPKPKSVPKKRALVASGQNSRASTPASNGTSKKRKT